jgi:triacylglycerol lipase
VILAKSQSGFPASCLFVAVPFLATLCWLFCYINKESKIKPNFILKLHYVNMTVTILTLLIGVLSMSFEAEAAPSSAKGNKNTIVMLHGLWGWGEQPLAGKGHYFGGLNGNIYSFLRTQGHQVVAPSLGPVSSCKYTTTLEWFFYTKVLTHVQNNVDWERSCELYAQLTGTVVDYGVARSKTFGHQRFGQDFSKTAPLVPGFSAGAAKINIIGHSMGGATARMFVHLMKYGDQNEIDKAKAMGVVASRLFWTNKTSSQVSGVFSVSGTLRGSSLSEVNGLTPLLFQISLGQNPSAWDLKLGHWGIANPGPADTNQTYTTHILDLPWGKSNSNALFDLQPQNMAKSPLLNFVKNDPAVQYMSVAARLTIVNATNKPFEISDPTVPSSLSMAANMLGSHQSPFLGAQSSSWFPNDGAVSIESTKTDVSGEVNTYKIDLTAKDLALPPGKPVLGKFNFVGEIPKMDHVMIVGQEATGGLRNQMYANMATLLASI